MPIVGADSEWTSCRYGTADEALHDPGGAALYNESVYVNFVCDDPADREGDCTAPIGGILRVGLRPTDGYRELSLNLPLSDGSVLFLYEREALAADAFVAGRPRWRCAGMELEAVVPTRRWRLRYDGDRPRRVSDSRRLGIDPGQTLRSASRTPVSVDLVFEGRFAMHALTRSGDIAQDRAVAFARNHYEQFGTVTGTIAVGEHSCAIRDAGAFRDHSWGPRDWQAAPHSDFSTVLDGDGSAIVCFSARVEGIDHVSGVRWTDDGPEPVSAFAVHSGYAGEVELREPLALVVGVGGRELRYSAGVRSFLPLRHRSGERMIRIGQALLAFDGSAGPALGWTDLTRPAV